jgi:hypothetical protein
VIRWRKPAAAAELSPTLVSLLARGWSHFEQPPDDEDPFAVWTYSDAALVALYDAHTAVVDEAARRCGLARPWIAEAREFWQRVGVMR